MTRLTVKEFIKVLEKFPQDSQICITNSEGAFEGDFLLGVSHESDYDYESGDGYDIVGISVLTTYNQMNYAWLVHDCEQEIYGDKVWYNTEDYIEIYDCEGHRTRLYFDEETKKFYDWNKR